MNLLNYLDKDNLHHAYLIEGIPEKVIPDIFSFVEEIGIETLGNPDFYHIALDSFKIEDARNLKALSYEKGVSENQVDKKIFLISANNFLLEAQNTLLKIFEEPKENTHFFIVVPNADNLLKTLISRFYLIRTESNIEDEIKKAEDFIKMSIKDRIDFVKLLLVDDEEDEEKKDKMLGVSTNRSQALKFINALEVVLKSKITSIKNTDNNFFQHLFKIREFINQPGSSLKTLMESVALNTPSF